MAASSTSSPMGQFVDFLQSVYGQDAMNQIANLSGMSVDDIRKASESFTPAFLDGMMAMGASGSSKTTSGSQDAWQAMLANSTHSLMQQGQEAMEMWKQAPMPNLFKAAAPSGQSEDWFTSHKAQMEQFYHQFMQHMGKESHRQFLNQASEATGIPASQLQALYPILTAYGMMPLMPPSMDDPAGWVDYLGDMGRRKFREVNKEMGALPSPMAAAFEGLLAGFFPASQDAKAAPTAVTDEEKAAAQMEELKEAGLEFQTNYIKGLNTLFESYQSGFDKDKS